MHAYVASAESSSDLIANIRNWFTFDPCVKERTDRDGVRYSAFIIGMQYIDFCIKTSLII